MYLYNMCIYIYFLDRKQHRIRYPVYGAPLSILGSGSALNTRRAPLRSWCVRVSAIGTAGWDWAKQSASPSLRAKLERGPWSAPLSVRLPHRPPR